MQYTFLGRLANHFDLLISTVPKPADAASIASSSTWLRSRRDEWSTERGITS